MPPGAGTFDSGAVQVALSFVLLVGAILLCESLWAVDKPNPGFSTEKTLVTSIDFAAAGYSARRAWISRTWL